MDGMQILVERKLRSEISRKDRDLRRMLGHFDMLERVNSEMRKDESSSNNEFGSQATQYTETRPSSQHVEDVALLEPETGSEYTDWPDLDKDMVVVEGVEVDDDDDTASSDGGSLPDDDELPEYDDMPDLGSVQIHCCHAPPSYVENVTNELGKMSMPASIKENIYEVAEDD